MNIVDPAPPPPMGLLRQALLEHAQRSDGPPVPRRVWVNRTLRLESIRYIGFDLDWTLAPYYRLPLDELTFVLALDKLIGALDYPETIRRAEFRPHFPHRGLIVDRETGVVLKMNRHRYVGRAYLGRELLSQKRRAELFRQAPIELGSDRYYRADTLFELPEVNLFSELVELAQRRPGAMPAKKTPELFADVRQAVDSMHADGSLKSRIAGDLHRFLPRNAELALALQRLLLGDRRLLLITNSDWSYTNTLCSHILSEVVPGLGSWRNLFSLTIVSAGKPDFFRKRRPFVELAEDGSPLREVEVPEWGKVYAGGNRQGLMKLLLVPGEQMLYVGDHIYGDIVSTKLTTSWRTALIVRELEDELDHLISEAADIRHLAALKRELSRLGTRMDDLKDVLALSEELAVEPRLLAECRTDLAARQSEHRALRHRTRELEEQISARFNPTWGSVFKEGGSKSLFGAQVEDFACLYSSRVSNFAYYGSNHYFRVLQDPLAHEVGE